MGARIHFAHLSFKWSNLAAHNAGVTVVIVGVTSTSTKSAALFSTDLDGGTAVRHVDNINPYLVPGQNLVVEAVSRPLDGRDLMVKGNMPSDGGNLIMNNAERLEILRQHPDASEFIYKFSGSHEFISGEFRYCLWISDEDFDRASSIPAVAERLEKVADFRRNAKAPTTRPYADFPHKFRQIQDVAKESAIIVPRHSSENRLFLPVGLLNADSIVSDSALVIYDAPLWNIAIIASRLHQAWVATVCGKLETRYRYSNTLGWNAFPIPKLTEKNIADLTRSAEDILLSREAHFPATVADIYDPEEMPNDLREAHDRNDETLERIYMGRRFKNDTERLEKLFELYTKMAAANNLKKNKTRKKA